MNKNVNSLGLKPPRIRKIIIEKQLIYVMFFNDEIKKYNIIPLLEKENYKKLINTSYLKLAKVDPGGYGISWDDDCDLSENELWTKGESIHDSAELDRIQLLFNTINRDIPKKGLD